MVGRRLRLGRALLLAVASLTVGVASYLLGVQSPLGQAAEARVLDAAAFTVDPPAPLNLVSIPSVMLALLLVGGLALAVHGVARSLGIVVVAALAIIASQLLKQEMLVRPGLFDFDTANTFPSGHMTVFTVLAIAIVWAVPARWAALAAVVAAVVLGAAGWQLLAFGWHRPSDVLGAQALGVCCFAVASVLSLARAPDRRPVAIRGSAARRTAGALTLAGWVLVLGGLGLAAASVLAGPETLMLTAGEFGALGTSALTARVALALAP